MTSVTRSRKEGSGEVTVGLGGGRGYKNVAQFLGNTSIYLSFVRVEARRKRRDVVNQMGM